MVFSAWNSEHRVLGAPRPGSMVSWSTQAAGGGSSGRCLLLASEIEALSPWLASFTRQKPPPKLRCKVSIFLLEVGGWVEGFMLTLSCLISRSTGIGNCQSQSQRCVSRMGGSLEWRGTVHTVWLFLFLRSKMACVQLRRVRRGQAARFSQRGTGGGPVPSSQGACSEVGLWSGPCQVGHHAEDFEGHRRCRWHDQGQHCRSWGTAAVG